MKYQIELKRINDDETVESLAVQDIRSPNVIVVHPGETGPSIFKSLDRIRIDEKHEIRQIYCEIAEKLRETYKDYIGHVNVRRIMFYVDDAWEPTEKTSFNSRIHIDIRKASKVERIFTGFDYVISMKEHYLDMWTNAQVSAAIMSQLLRIDRTDNSVRKYTEDFASKLVSTFGSGYLEDGAQIPDISEQAIDLKEFPKAKKDQIEITEYIAEKSAVQSDEESEEIPFDEEPEEIEDFAFDVEEEEEEEE